MPLRPRIVVIMAKPKDDGSLKRLGGGRWQTHDGRFTIEPQSGTWVLVDAEQTDDLGLPLVRGPFGSLTAARASISAARAAPPAVSPLAAQVARHRDRPAPPAPAPRVAKIRAHVEQPAPIVPPPPPEPQWLRDLEPVDHASALGLIARLAKIGVADPEGLARQEIADNQPAVAAFAVKRALAALGSEASPAAVARTLVQGRAPDLEVGWRLVDGDGRALSLDPDDQPSK